MQITQRDDKTVLLSELNPLVCELLRRIPPSADPSGSEAARDRLFSTPTSGEEPEFERDWKEYVEPDLRMLFQSALEIVRGDLEALPRADEEDGGGLTIPITHLESWLHGLNQARLVLAASHDFTEAELERVLPVEGGARELVLFQIHFYAQLQECFLNLMAGE